MNVCPRLFRYLTLISLAAAAGALAFLLISKKGDFLYFLPGLGAFTVIFMAAALLLSLSFALLDGYQLTISHRKTRRTQAAFVNRERG